MANLLLVGAVDNPVFAVTAARLRQAMAAGAVNELTRLSSAATFQPIDENVINFQASGINHYRHNDSLCVTAFGGVVTESRLNTRVNHTSWRRVENLAAA
jgi:hypothetical protein